MTKAYRPLTGTEIEQLRSQGCTCSEWAMISVCPEFQARSVRESHFSGTIRLGQFHEPVEIGGGALHPSGIYRATCHNCCIGDHSLVRHVGGIVANMDIADHVVVDHVGRIEVNGVSTFGNNRPIHAVNETGGRAVPLYDRLSAPLAYLMAFFRHDPKLIASLTDWIAAYAQEQASDRGALATGAQLRDCGSICNTRIGPAAQLTQVSTLENGTVQSDPDHPTRVGPDVIARHFILAEGATVTDGSHLDHCFIGQGTVLKSFKAEHSLFFANCEAYLGESCAVFAGPFTVSHHQGSLLIATCLSFFNAGSHTNQSNHMYRLGPYHQGIMERGCKTASGTYLCWPGHIGAFTFVRGRHYSHPEFADLPFSYLIDKKERSVLHPGAALATVGLTRDARKWDERDRRRANALLDHYTTNPLNPYTMGKVLRGIASLMKRLDNIAQGNRRRTLSKVAVERGLQLYQWALDQFWGDCLINSLDARKFRTEKELQDILRENLDAGAGPWLDLAGLLVPAQQVHQLIGDIHSGRITTLDGVSQQFGNWHENYDSLALSWALSRCQKDPAAPEDTFSPQTLVLRLNRYKEATSRLTSIILADGGKEFDTISRIGYGLENAGHGAEEEFDAVRGTAADSLFLQSVTKNMNGRLQKADTLITLIQTLS